MSEAQVIICGAIYVDQEVREEDCPFCKSKQKFLVRYEEWHGATSNCLGCGATWMESGEWLVPDTKKRRLAKLPKYLEIAAKIEVNHDRT